MKSQVLFLILTFVICLQLRAEQKSNGLYSAPDFASMEYINGPHAEPFWQNQDRLYAPDFVDRGSHYQRPSYYFTAEGQHVLWNLGTHLISLMPQYNRMVSIGRSGTAIMTYVNGVITGLAPVMRPPTEEESRALEELSPINDLPYSSRSWSIPDDQRKALRAYLKKNGLSPSDIAKLKRPILFLDFVYTARGVISLFEEMYRWAKESRKTEAFKKNVHFVGYYSPHFLAETKLKSLYHASAQEMKMNTPDLGYSEIATYAKTIPLPNSDMIEKFVGKVIPMAIPPELYLYTVTHSHQAQASFKPEFWNQPIPEVKNEITGKADNPAYLELFHIFAMGRKYSHLYRSEICKAVFDGLHP
jgi:hypothetical protein